MAAAELQPLLNHCKILLNTFLCHVFIMHYTANFSMRQYARFSQIGSHIAIIYGIMGRAP